MAEEDFDLQSLADYLHIEQNKINRLADRGQIPGRRVGGDWKFSRAEIHHWLEDRMGVSDDAELAEMESVLQRSATPGEEAAISIAEMLPVEAIAVPLEARTRTKVITRMTELAAGTGLLWDADKMADAVRAREDLYPTSIEGGVALMHPRRPMPTILGQAFLALGITPSGIPFGSKGLTDVFFLICSVTDQEHLRTLARLSRLIGDAELLESLRSAPDARAAHDLITEGEALLSEG